MHTLIWLEALGMKVLQFECLGCVPRVRLAAMLQQRPETHQVEGLRLG